MCFTSLQTNSVVQSKMTNITVIKLLYVFKLFDFFHAFHRSIVYFGENRSDFSVDNVLINAVVHIVFKCKIPCQCPCLYCQCLY